MACMVGGNPEHLVRLPEPKPACAAAAAQDTERYPRLEEVCQIDLPFDPTATQNRGSR